MTLIPIHVLAGATAILVGLLTLYVAKGGPLHRKAGTVFVYAMLVMALSGAVIAVGREGAAVNIPAGLVTTYLVITAFLTVQPPSERSRQIERGAMAAAFALSAGCVVSAIVSAAQGHMGFLFPTLMFGAGGIRGSARLRRHLWRMCTALFIAAASFFLGPVRRIPEPLRIAPLRFIPLLVLLTMAYWLWRYRRKRIASGAAEAI
jgi:uncharacterized membrane protein